MKLGLLLTAAIDPGTTPFVGLGDPTSRKDDYLAAFRAWLQVPGIDHIVLCENTDQPMDDFVAASEQDPRVEVMSFAGNLGAHAKGKGRGEFAIINHALDRSADLSSCDIVMKLTGRLYLKNAERMIELVRADRSGAVVWTDLRAHLTAGESRVFFATPTFLRERFLHRAHEVDDHAGHYFEHVLARAAHDAMSAGDSWRPLPVTPQIVGRSGSTGASYRGSYPMRIALRVRAWLERRLHRGFAPGA